MTKPSKKFSPTLDLSGPGDTNINQPGTRRKGHFSEVS